MKKLPHKKQSQPLRIEFPHYGSFTTSRTIKSRLWFANNSELDGYNLAYLAKYREKYEINLYAFVMQGNHYHTTTAFPGCNRASFFRDLNARIVEGVRKHVPSFEGGPLFERRYAEQTLPTPADIEEQFFYCALQPVLAGLVEHIEDYSGYNSFYDAIWGRERVLQIVRYGEYNSKRRSNKKAQLKDFTDTFVLKYNRLPGYEYLSQEAYAQIMFNKFELRRRLFVDEMTRSGHRFPSPKQLRKIVPGSLPRTTKKSKRHDARPIVLCKCPVTRNTFLTEYFSIFAAYKVAARRYLRREEKVVFPPGTYKPPGPFVPYN